MPKRLYSETITAFMYIKKQIDKNRTNNKSRNVLYMLSTWLSKNLSSFSIHYISKECHNNVVSCQTGNDAINDTTCIRKETEMKSGIQSEMQNIVTSSVNTFLAILLQYSFDPLVRWMSDDSAVMVSTLFQWPHVYYIYIYILNLFLVLSTTCRITYVITCLSPLTLWVRIPLRRGVLDTTLCDKVCQWVAAGRWFSLDTQVSSTNKTDRHCMKVLSIYSVTDCYCSNYH